MSRNKYLALIRRELQENRSLWIVPVAVAGLLLLTVIFGKSNMGPGAGISISPPPQGMDLAEVGAMTLIGTYVFLGIVAAVVCLTYLLDCLYAERKDRSILFWKSLPVSDAETVLAKLFVAMVLVPVGVLALALVLQPLLAVIFYLRYESLGDYLALRLVAGWPEALGRVAAAWLFGLLWYLPFAAYLMLASVLARRAPLAYAAMPPLVLILWELWMLDGNHIRGFLAERLLLGGRPVELLLNVQNTMGRWYEAFLVPDLWVGVAVAAGMLYIIIRLRRYRDDT